MRINSLRKNTPMLLSLALLLAVSAFAQNQRQLSGTAHDPQGGAVAAQGHVERRWRQSSTRYHHQRRRFFMPSQVSSPALTL